MPKRIPVKAAKQINEEYGCRQVILLAWDGEFTHIVTYGKTVDDCAHAAAGGNMLKERWGWPECNDQPSRVRKLEARIQELEKQLAETRQLQSANAVKPQPTKDPGEEREQKATE
jgi:hypothetical protein